MRATKMFRIKINKNYINDHFFCIDNNYFLCRIDSKTNKNDIVPSKTKQQQMKEKNTFINIRNKWEGVKSTQTNARTHPTKNIGFHANIHKAKIRKQNKFSYISDFCPPFISCIPDFWFPNKINSEYWRATINAQV